MRILELSACALLLCAQIGPAFAQDAPPAAPPEGGGPDTIPLKSLIATVADSSGEDFIVDPRVRANVTLIGQDPGNVDYDALLAILQVHGFAAVPTGDYVRIVPDANIRQMPTPVISDESSVRDLEYASKVITLTSRPAAQLVPVLRPLMPRYGHLAADTCSNALVITDTAANIARIETLIESLDTGEAYEPPPSCQPFRRPPAEGGG